LLLGKLRLMMLVMLFPITAVEDLYNQLHKNEQICSTEMVKFNRMIIHLLQCYSISSDGMIWHDLFPSRPSRSHSLHLVDSDRNLSTSVPGPQWLCQLCALPSDTRRCCVCLWWPDLSHMEGKH